MWMEGKGNGWFSQEADMCLSLEEITLEGMLKCVIFALPLFIVNWRPRSPWTRCSRSLNVSLKESDGGLLSHRLWWDIWWTYHWDIWWTFRYGAPGRQVVGVTLLKGIAGPGPFLSFASWLPWDKATCFCCTHYHVFCKPGPEV